MSKIRSVNDGDWWNRIFRGGKMKKKKMITWVCECKKVDEKYCCELTTQDVGTPHICPFGYSNPDWKKKEQK